jgi:hypothetical protein
MSHSHPGVSTGRLILGPALISLAITLLRLIGELNHWSPTFFNRAAGGPGALVGIVWLVPILGVYFALALDEAGLGPERRGRALGFALAGIGLYFALAAGMARLSAPLVVRLVFFNVAGALCAGVAYRGWPALGRTLAAYGLAARVPVALIALLAISGNWGTHYELGPPGFPEMSLLPKWLTVGLMPQLVFWIAFTVVVGSLCGGLALLFPRKPR